MPEAQPAVTMTAKAVKAMLAPGSVWMRSTNLKPTPEQVTVKRNGSANIVYLRENGKEIYGVVPAKHELLEASDGHLKYVVDETDGYTITMDLVKPN